MTISFDGPEQVAAYRLLAMRSAVGLQAKTGMKMSNRANWLAAARAECGSKKRSAKDVYADFDAYMVSLGFDSRPL